MQFQFTSRKYGGGSAFCWASVKHDDGTMLDLGDPWPAFHWPQSILEPVARIAIAKHDAELAEARGDHEAAAEHLKAEEAALAEWCAASAALNARRQAKLQRSA